MGPAAARAGEAPETIAVVSDGVLGAVTQLCGQIQRLGARPVLITGPADEARLEAWRARYECVTVLSRPESPADLAAAARRMAAGGRLSALFSCFDGLCLPAAQAAASLGLPHPALPGLATSRDKARTRQALADAAIPSVRWARVTGAADLPGAAARVGFPAVLKPVSGTASHFVSRVADLAAPTKVFERATRLVHDSWPSLYSPTALSAGSPRPQPAQDPDPRPHPAKRPGPVSWPGPAEHAAPAAVDFILEEFLEGPEYTLDAVVRDGQVHPVAAFDKFIVDPQGFLECAFATPFLSGGPGLAGQLWSYLDRCLSATGVDDSLVHAEVVVTPRGPRLIEINAGRPGGQILVRAMADLCGIDLLAEVLALATGRPRPPAHPPAVSGQIATYTVFPPASGTVVSIDGIEEMRADPRVVDILPYCGPGDHVDIEDKEFFAVNVLAAGLPRHELVPFYDEIRRRIRIRVKADPPR